MSQRTAQGGARTSRGPSVPSVSRRSTPSSGSPPGWCGPVRCARAGSGPHARGGSWWCSGSPVGGRVSRASSATGRARCSPVAGDGLDRGGAQGRDEVLEGDERRRVVDQTVLEPVARVSWGSRQSGEHGVEDSLAAPARSFGAGGDDGVEVRLCRAFTPRIARTTRSNASVASSSASRTTPKERADRKPSNRATCTTSGATLSRPPASTSWTWSRRSPSTCRTRSTSSFPSPMTTRSRSSWSSRRLPTSSRRRAGGVTGPRPRARRRRRPPRPGRSPPRSATWAPGRPASRRLLLPAAGPA